MRLSSDDHRADAVVPGVSATEGYIAEIGNAVVEHSAAVGVMAVVKEPHLSVTEDLDRTDLVGEVLGQRRQTIALGYAEVIALVGAVGVEAGSAVRVGAIIPGLVPVGVGIAVDPGIVSCGWGSGRRFLRDGTNSTCNDEQSSKTLHTGIPPRAEITAAEIRRRFCVAPRVGMAGQG